MFKHTFFPQYQWFDSANKIAEKTTIIVITRKRDKSNRVYCLVHTGTSSNVHLTTARHLGCPNKMRNTWPNSIGENAFKTAVVQYIYSFSSLSFQSMRRLANIDSMSGDSVRWWLSIGWMFHVCWDLTSAYGSPVLKFNADVCRYAPHPLGLLTVLQLGKLCDNGAITWPVLNSVIIRQGLSQRPV